MNVVSRDAVQIVSLAYSPRAIASQEHLDGTASEFGLRNPAIARALFRAGVIEQYGTGTPCIKEACEAAGVRFRFEQTVNSTVVVFERPGSQVNDRTGSAICDAVNAAADSATFENLDEAEKVALRIAHDEGRVTKKGLMEQAGVGRTKATQTLNQLADKGILAWVGKRTNDPYQYYRLNESTRN